MVRRVFAIAGAIFLPGASDALGGVEQALAIGIVAGPADQRADRLGDMLGHGDLGRGGDDVTVYRVMVRIVHVCLSFRRAWRIRTAETAKWLQVQPKVSVRTADRAGRRPGTRAARRARRRRGRRRATRSPR